jgi:hypothetical protein
VKAAVDDDDVDADRATLKSKLIHNERARSANVGREECGAEGGTDVRVAHRLRC